MGSPLSRLDSLTVLLYLFIVISQFGFGLYYGQQVEPPVGLTLLYFLCFLWIVGGWLRRDSRKRGIPWIYDMGLFLYIAWPFILPWYLLKSRGAKGLLVILGFVGAYLGALIFGIAISVVTTEMQ